jgi:hypothetical protein
LNAILAIPHDAVNTAIGHDLSSMLHGILEKSAMRSLLDAQRTSKRTRPAGVGLAACVLRDVRYGKAKSFAPIHEDLIGGIMLNARRFGPDSLLDTF